MDKNHRDDKEISPCAKKENVKKKERDTIF